MDEEYDFVVVGSGGGSMCAGLVMREAGKSVLILEKTDLIGGSTARAGGVMWIPNNRFMVEQGIEDSLEKATAYLDAVVSNHNDTPGTTPERRRTYLQQAPEMLEFLIGKGIPFSRGPYWPDYYDDLPGGSELGRTVVADLFDVNQLGAWKDRLRPNNFTMPAPTYEAARLPLIKVSWQSRWLAFKVVMRIIGGKLSGKHWITAGAALQGRMLQAALRAGIELRTNAAVKQIIVDDNGGVTGVTTEREGKPWRIGARCGVLLNAGGFAQNQAMRDQYIPHTKAEWSWAAPGDTGDMHLEMMRLGAAMAQMEETVGNQITLPPGYTQPSGVQMQLACPHAFLVDQSGERYMNEGGSYMAFCKGMLQRHETVPAVPSWMIVDSQFTARYMLADTMPGTRKPAAWTQSGYMKSSDTIAGLARACNIDAARLVATVDRFNGFARANKDDDFGRGDRAYDRWLGDHTHRPSASLGTVEKGPFHAVPVLPGDVGTFGGVVTDAHARVLREDGSAIPGLYATGTTTASMMGRTYPGAGSSIGPAFTWGYIAARHAVAQA
jgi:3-oxosteroid 1-dehydrogenase